MSLARIVEIAEDGRHLSAHRGFMVVSRGGAEVGRVPLDDVAALVASAHGLSYSNYLLAALAERGAPLVLCGSHHRPVAVLWPLEGHHQLSARIDAQARATLPLRKRLWAAIVKAKLGNQAAVLDSLGVAAAPVRALVRRLRSGDPDNVEAQGARRYWPLLMGPEFRRDPASPGTNSLLNYGYAVLRAATARSVVAAGLHPALALHHANAGNPFRLADDLMEPFRPMVDLMVRRLLDAGTAQVDPNAKRALAMLLYRDLPGEAGLSPVIHSLQRLATSLARVYLGEARVLDVAAVPASVLATWGLGE